MSRKLIRHRLTKTVPIETNHTQILLWNQITYFLLRINGKSNSTDEVFIKYISLVELAKVPSSNG